MIQLIQSLFFYPLCATQTIGRSAQFYPDQDISFMDYFLELSQEENQGQFVVRHEKLIEYGICLATGGSGDIKKRLNKLGLSENEDYWLSQVSEPLKGKRGGATSGKSV